MHHTRSSGRYAKALLDLAMEMGKIDRVKTDMEQLLGTLSASRELRLVMQSPVLRPERKVAIFKALFESSFDPLSMQFLALLAKNRREMGADQIATDFIDGWRAHKGISKVVVRSAYPLEASQREMLLQKAAVFASGQIELEERTDSELLGGFVLRAGDRQIDMSISARLDKLRNEFDDNLYIREI
jgi:F-type H+-transporting ATPase subunit delta